LLGFAVAGLRGLAALRSTIKHRETP